MDAADQAERQYEMDVARSYGRRARRNGETKNACPYDDDDPQAAAWISGWDTEDDARKVAR